MSLSTLKKKILTFLGCVCFKFIKFIFRITKDESLIHKRVKKNMIGFERIIKGRLMSRQVNLFP